MDYSDGAAEFLRRRGGCFDIEMFPDREHWLIGRRSHLGASDAAAVLGMSPWKTEAELWKEKRASPDPDEESNSNPDIERGRKSEEHIRELFAIENGLDVYDGTNIMLVSRDRPFMSCTLDGCFDDADGRPTVLEIKSVRHGSGGEWSGDTCPQHYFCQLLHQLYVTGWDRAMLLVRFARSEDWQKAYERLYVVEREEVEEQIDRLVSKEERFWKDNVVGGRRPAVRMPAI